MSKEVKKEIIEVNGKKLVFPNPTQDQLPFKLVRTTRGLKGERMHQEAMMGIMEFFLDEFEMDAWDELSGEDMNQALEAVQKIDFLIA